MTYTSKSALLSFEPFDSSFVPVFFAGGGRPGSQGRMVGSALALNIKVHRLARDLFKKIISLIMLIKLSGNRKPFIRFLNHGSSNEVFYLKSMLDTNNQLHLGSGTICAIRLSAKRFVEDHHVTMSLQAGQVHIWPKDPSYPIYINGGICHQPRCMKDGDRVRIGEVEFELHDKSLLPMPFLALGILVLLVFGLLLLRIEPTPVSAEQGETEINCINAEDFTALANHVLNPVYVAFTNMIRPDFYTSEEKQEKKAEIINKYFISPQDTVEYFGGKNSKSKQMVTIAEYLQRLIVRQEKCDCLIELQVEKVFPIQYNEALGAWDLKVKFTYGYKRSSFHRIQGGEGPIKVDYFDYNVSLAHFQIAQVGCAGKLQGDCCELRIRKIEALEIY